MYANKFNAILCDHDHPLANVSHWSRLYHPSHSQSSSTTEYRVGTMAVIPMSSESPTTDARLALAAGQDLADAHHPMQVSSLVLIA